MSMLGKKAAVFLIALLLLANFFAWDFLFFLEEKEGRVVFFDVGQGDAALVRTPGNHHILIDGGPGDAVVSELRREMPLLLKEIDLILLSHAHYDHVSGLMEALDAYEVRNVMWTGAIEKEGVSRDWKELVEERGFYTARAGAKVRGEGFVLEILYPFEDLRGETVDDLNATSAVSRLKFAEGPSFLFTGDIYKEQERELVSYAEGCHKEDVSCAFTPSLSVDVLDVPHHGSKTSSSKEFLSATSPLKGVIMVGENNRHGHPSKEALQRLRNQGMEVMRTDRDGNIMFDI